MTSYKIIPVDPPGKAIELADEDSALAFKLAQDLRASLVDVLRDGKYAFSLCRMRGENGYWAIYQRPESTLERPRLARNRKLHHS